MHVLIEFQILRVIEKSRGITFNLQDHLLGGVSIPHTRDESSMANNHRPLLTLPVRP